MTEHMTSAQTFRARGEAFASRVLDACGDAVGVVSAGGRIEYVSRGFVELLGVPRRALVGHPVWEYLHPEEAPGLTRLHARAQYQTGTHAALHRWRRADGTFIWAETVLNALEQQEGAPSSVTYASRDVTSWYAAERADFEVRHAWAAVFDALREGVLLLDGTGCVVTANQAAARFLGVGPQELAGSVGREQVVVIDESNRPIPRENLPSTRALRSGEVQDELLTYRRKDGTAVWLLARAVPVRTDGDEAATRVAVLLQDAVGPPLGNRSHNGGPTAGHANGLTAREGDVLRLLGDGLDVRAVASRLGISVHTARSHVKSIMGKLNARTQLQAVVIAARTGLLTL